MSLAVITLSPEGAILADHLMRRLPESHLYVHEKVKGRSTEQRDLLASSN